VAAEQSVISRSLSLSISLSLSLSLSSLMFIFLRLDVTKFVITICTQQAKREARICFQSVPFSGLARLHLDAVSLLTTPIVYCIEIAHNQAIMLLR
jgi:hypothetical protein